MPHTVQDPFHADDAQWVSWLRMNCLRASSLVILLTLVFACSARTSGVQASTANVLLARNRTEPVVAVDPLHPAHTVVFTNTDYNSPVNGGYPPGEYWSSNGGATFTSGAAPIVGPYSTTADPSVTIARDGTVFYSYLGEVPGFCEGAGGAVIVTHSIDHGRSFRPAVIADSNPDDDKPDLAVESGRPNHVFLVWDRIYAHRTAIWYTRSTDGGAHFQTSRSLFDSKRSNFSPAVVVAPGGRLYVFWSTFPNGGEQRSLQTRLMMRSSRDDGVHFSPARIVAGPFRAIPQITQPGSLRNLTAPAAITDSRGNLWLAWARPSAHYHGRRVTADIEIKRSSDGGKTWTNPVPVNDVSAGDRFMPALTVWPDRSVGIVFYDRRRSYDLLDVYAARIWYWHGIDVSANVRLNRSASPVADIHYIPPGSTCFAPGRFFGDYIGDAAQPSGRLCGVWSDTQLRVPGETDIWFARVRIPKQAGRRPSAVSSPSRAP